MGFREVDLTSWPRRPHFELFDAMDHPWLDVSSTVAGAEVWAVCRGEGRPSFSAALLFLAIGAVNEVEAFRMRIRDGHVITHDRVHVGSTVLRGDETFGFDKA